MRHTKNRETSQNLVVSTIGNRRKSRQYLGFWIAGLKSFSVNEKSFVVVASCYGVLSNYEFQKIMILFLQIFHGILLQMMVMMIYDYDGDDDTEVEQATHGNVMESAQKRRDDDGLSLIHI